MSQSIGALTSALPTSQGQDVITRGVMRSDSFQLPVVANAKVFPFAQFSGGMIWVDGACTIIWYVAQSQDATVAAAYDDAATPAAITQTPGGAGWYPIPIKLFGAAAIAPCVTTGTIQAILCLKK